ncbi:hypothetical protein QAD02_007758 [Eretmocerus hayati]|uniref:Uncharacterized protein n=1 Tax=Eretmocerus hayati TaxID=131215 RepID=A0ACC2N4T4_9HYME|nr:hypothetical protein QAD02_007758 [Eretmocerus hayati]
MPDDYPVTVTVIQLSNQQLESMNCQSHSLGLPVDVQRLPSPSSAESLDLDSNSVICEDTSDCKSVICLEEYQIEESDTDSDSVICLDTLHTWDCASVTCLGEYPATDTDFNSVICLDNSDSESVLCLDQPVVSRFVQGFNTPFSPQDLEALSDWIYTPNRDLSPHSFSPTLSSPSPTNSALSYQSLLYSPIDSIPHDDLIVKDCPYTKAVHPVSSHSLSQGKQVELVWDQLFDTQKAAIDIERQNWTKTTEKKLTRKVPKSELKVAEKKDPSN